MFWSLHVCSVSLFLYSKSNNCFNARVMKAPDISSEVYFPSLGNSEDTAPKGAWGKNP